MRVVVAAIAWAILLTPLSVRADKLSDAEHAMAHGQYAQARELLDPLAKAKKPRALALSGQLHALRGEKTEAEAQFYKLIDLYNDGTIRDEDGEALWAVAEAARGLGAYRDANDAFARAVRASPQNPQIEVAWADLFLEKYDAANAEQGLSKVLAQDPKHAQALERMARVRLEQGAPFSEVEQLLDRALESDPALVAAYVSRAGLALRDEDLIAADKHLSAALAINPHDLEALSVRAAVRFVADDPPGFQSSVKAVLAENPRFSRMYSIIATYAEWEHRYQELVQLADEALKLDPEDAYAHATRGLNLLRVGREKEGLASLTAAWSRDRYNVHVYNTLNLYDDVIAKEYVTSEASPFLLRTHQSERAVLRAYAIPLLQKAYADMVQRYGITPEGPLSIELYADPEHFSVRTSGMPHLGVQGVCFGKVLTALSPRGGEFNWGQILWHELSHVFHIQLSKSRVPRWFTEGLAEYETKRARPEWKREDDRQLYDALRRNALPALSELNHAFTHARSADELMVAYYASSVVMEYVVERFGFPKIPELLRLFQQGVPTDEVFTRGLGITLDALNRDFRTQLDARLGAKYAKDFRVDLARVAKDPAPSGDKGPQALKLALSGSEPQALALAQEVLKQTPQDALALYTRVHVALKRSDLAQAREGLLAMLAAGYDGYQLRMLLARTERKLGHKEEALAQLSKAEAIDSDRGEAWELRVEMATEADDKAGLKQALAQLSFLDQHARKPLNRLLALLAEQGDYPLLLERAEAGIYLDPENSELHRLLAIARLHGPKPESALPEAEWAVRLAPDEAQKKRAQDTLEQVRKEARGTSGARLLPAPARQQEAKGDKSR